MSTPNPMPSQKQAAGTPEHTPTPWTINHNEFGDPTINGPETETPIATVEGANAFHNAAQIVKCVNERDELLARLRSLEGRNEELGKALKMVLDRSVSGVSLHATFDGEQSAYDYALSKLPAALTP